MQTDKPQILGVQARLQAYSYLRFPQIPNNEALNLRGDCVIPNSFMMSCTGANCQGPMIFRVTSENTSRFFFTTMQGAEELQGMIVLPAWRMKEAGINDGDYVTVLLYQVPPASFVALSPADLSLLSLPSPIDSLSMQFDKLGAIYQNEEIQVPINGNSYKFKVVELKPSRVAHVKFTGELKLELRWSPELQAKISEIERREREIREAERAPERAPASAPAPKPQLQVLMSTPTKKEESGLILSGAKKPATSWAGSSGRTLGASAASAAPAAPATTTWAQQRSQGVSKGAFFVGKGRKLE